MSSLIDVLDDLAETFKDQEMWSAYHHIRAIAHSQRMHLSSCTGGKGLDFDYVEETKAGSMSIDLTELVMGLAQLSHELYGPKPAEMRPQSRLDAIRGRPRELVQEHPHLSDMLPAFGYRLIEIRPARSARAEIVVAAVNDPTTFITVAITAS